MLFWFTLVLFIISLAVAIIHPSYIESIGGFLITLCLGLAMLAMIICISYQYICFDSQVEAIQERHDALMFRLENEELRDEFGLINNDLVFSIRLWNEELRRVKKFHDNFWIGIFNPNVYEGFDCIDYNEILNKGEIKNAQ